MKRIILVGVLAVALFPARAFALFGVGDIVFDPAAFAQLVKSYSIGQSQLQNLGKIVGLNNEQLNNLRHINTAIGIVQGNVDPERLTMRQLAALSQGLGIDAKGAISTIYKQSGPFAGAIDIFMGASIDSFRRENSRPLRALSDWATETSVRSIGTAVGMESHEIRFATRVAKMTPAQRERNKLQIATGIAELATRRFFEAGEQRRVALQAEANLSTQAAKRASEATTLNETASALSEQIASQARLQALQAQQVNAANETLISRSSDASATLREMEARRAREEAEKRISNRLHGN